MSLKIVKKEVKSIFHSINGMMSSGRWSHVGQAQPKMCCRSESISWSSDYPLSQTPLSRFDPRIQLEHDDSTSGFYFYSRNNLSSSRVKLVKDRRSMKTSGCSWRWFSSERLLHFYLVVEGLKGDLWNIVMDKVTPRWSQTSSSVD